MIELKNHCSTKHDSGTRKRDLKEGSHLNEKNFDSNMRFDSENEDYGDSEETFLNFKKEIDNILNIIGSPTDMELRLRSDKNFIHQNILDNTKFRS